MCKGGCQPNRLTGGLPCIDTLQSLRVRYRSPTSLCTREAWAKPTSFCVANIICRTPLASLFEGRFPRQRGKCLRSRQKGRGPAGRGFAFRQSRREFPFPRNTLPQSASQTAPSKKGLWAQPTSFAQQTSFTEGIHHLRSITSFAECNLAPPASHFPPHPPRLPCVKGAVSEAD